MITIWRSHACEMRRDGPKLLTFTKLSEANMLSKHAAQRPVLAIVPHAHPIQQQAQNQFQRPWHKGGCGRPRLRDRGVWRVPAFQAASELAVTAILGSFCVLVVI